MDTPFGTKRSAPAFEAPQLRPSVLLFLLLVHELRGGVVNARQVES